MNREILFRGLSIESNEWVYGFLIANINPHKEETEYIEHMIYEGLRNIKRPVYIDPKTIGQYTGLTDKNGDKIFEGDIIEAWDEVHPYDDRPGQSYHKGVVVFRNGSFFLKTTAIQGREIFIQFIHADHIKVIGNIHQNPVL